MRKLFTLFTAACISAAATATDFNGRLMVLINGSASPSQEANISVNRQDDGKYTLELKNFMLGTGADAMGIGNIKITDTEATVNASGTTNLKTTQTITITEGDASGVMMWMGPMLGEIPVSIDADVDGEKTLAATIDIPFVSMNMQIKVLFDSRAYHIGNSDFESFHTAKLYSPLEDGSDWNYEAGPMATSDEPDHWHSFMGKKAPYLHGRIHSAHFHMRHGTPRKHRNKERAADFGRHGIFRCGQRHYNNRPHQHRKHQRRRPCEPLMELARLHWKRR